MTVDEIVPIVNGLAAMKFYPGDIDGRIAIAEELARMASSPDQIRHVVRRALGLYAEWPGVREIRGLFCNHYRAADGIECFSTVYPDGIPAEDGRPWRPGEFRELSPSEMRQISGLTEPANFPRDATDLLHEAIERDKAAKKAPLPNEAEIERIKAEQAENVKRREVQDARKRTAVVAKIMEGV